MRAVFSAILTIPLALHAAQAETFPTRDDFSVSLPSGWIEAPAEALRNIEAVLSQASQGAMTQKYDYGYQLASANTWFEYPYVLVQVMRRGRVPEGELTQFERIESGFREGADQVKESLGTFVSNVEQGKVVYDDAEHVLWSSFTMGVQGVGNVRALSAVKLTEFGFIQVNCYALEDSFDRYAPVFQGMVRDLDVAERYRYQPRLTDHAPTLWGINVGEVALSGGLGAIIGGVVGLIVYFRRRRQRRAG
jgi:hypothetical protein